tara:strand:+ start:88 stop:366 length:279 start_codon:yes stop_codon:yes gene_type:complete
MKTYTINVDVLDAVQDFYPGLTNDDARKIADQIVTQWDYSDIYNDISDQIECAPAELGIELDGKDGIEISLEEEESKERVLVLNPPPSRLFP